jgi:hypothetical protein
MLETASMQILAQKQRPVDARDPDKKESSQNFRQRGILPPTQAGTHLHKREGASTRTAHTRCKWRVASPHDGSAGIESA